MAENVNTNRSFCIGLALMLIVSTVLNGSFLMVNSNRGEVHYFSEAIGGPKYDSAYSIQQTVDGGYIVAGQTYSFGAGGFDALVIKLDNEGDTVWSKTIGGAGNDFLYSIQQTMDRGYIAAGETESFGGGSYDVLIIKLNSGGDVMWSETIGGTWHDSAHSIKQTADGGYIVSGETFSFGEIGHALVIRLDSEGRVIWCVTMGGRERDFFHSIQQTSDGGFIAAGESYSFGESVVLSSDLFLVKLDSDGKALWSETIGASGNEYARSVKQTSDGGYIVTGESSGYSYGSYDFLVVKLDSNGIVIWCKSVGGASNDYARSIAQTDDGGYVIAGLTYSYPGYEGDVFVVNLDSDGNAIWCKTIGGKKFDMARSIQQTSDGGYVVAGSTESFGAGDYDFFIAKLNFSGDMPYSNFTRTVSPIVRSQSPTVKPLSLIVGFISPAVDSQSLLAITQSVTITKLWYSVVNSRAGLQSGENAFVILAEELTAIMAYLTLLAVISALIFAVIRKRNRSTSQY